MATAVRPNLDRESPFDIPDRVMHTIKYAERAFGAEIGQIGTVEMDGQKAALIVTVEGVPHKLHWSRQPNGEIFWFADAEDEPIRAGPSDRALARLRSYLSTL